METFATELHKAASSVNYRQKHKFVSQTGRSFKLMMRVLDEHYATLKQQIIV